MTLYATAAEVWAALSPSGTAITAADEAAINTAGSAACELIDDFCGRTFGTVADVRYYAATDPWRLNIHDLAVGTATIETSTNLDGTYDVTWSASDFQLEPLNQLRGGVAWPYDTVRVNPLSGREFPVSPIAGVRVTSTFGWAAVPARIKQAAILQAARFYARRSSPMGVAGFNDLGVVRVSRDLDPDVKVLIERFAKGGSVGGSGLA